MFTSKYIFTGGPFSIAMLVYQRAHETTSKTYIPFKLFVVFLRLHLHFVSMTCLWKFARKPSLHPIRRNEPRSRNSGFSTVSAYVERLNQILIVNEFRFARQKKIIPIFGINIDIMIWYISNSLPESNIAPARKPSQKETGLPTIHFQVLLLMEEILHQLKGSLSRQFTRFCTSQVVVWDFFHQQYVSFREGSHNWKDMPFQSQLWPVLQLFRGEVDSWTLLAFGSATDFFVSLAHPSRRSDLARFGWSDFCLHHKKIGVHILLVTLPETNSSHLKIRFPKRKVISQPPASGAMFALGRSFSVGCILMCSFPLGKSEGIFLFQSYQIITLLR